MIFNESESGAEHLRWEIATADVFKRRNKKQTHRDVIHAWFCACINNWITMKQVVCQFYKGNLIWIFHWICVTNGKTKKSLQDIGIYRFYLLIKNRLFLFKKLKKNELWPPFDAFEIETFGFFCWKRQKRVYQINCVYRTDGNDVIFWICRSFNLLL